MKSDPEESAWREGQLEVVGYVSGVNELYRPRKKKIRFGFMPLDQKELPKHKRKRKRKR